MYKIDENNQIRYYSIDTPEYHDYQRRRFSQDNIIKLKAMRENVTWEIEEERREFLRQLYDLIENWTGQLPHLRDIFRRDEINWLVAEEVKSKKPCSFIDFVIETDYKDEPDVDKYGKPSPRRTTAVHHLFGERTDHYSGLVSKLFNIYDRFDVNYTDEFGLTHFHVACRHGCELVVYKFLELGRVDPNCLVPETGDSPLHLALDLYSDGKKILRLLLPRGANPNLTNNKGMTPLHSICDSHCNNEVELSEMLFKLSEEKYHPVQIDARDELGNTPLHLALQKGPKMLVELLLKRGANAHLANKEGFTPLHIICNSHSSYNSNLLKVLFELSDEKYHPVEIDARDELENTPLHLALYNGDKEIVELLLRRGAHTNLANKEGFTPLHIICNSHSSYNSDLLKMIFELSDAKYHPVQINARDELGNTPLHLALNNGPKKVVELLLKRGANPNVANKEGFTPLHIACNDNFDDEELVKMLFKFSNIKYHPVHINAQDDLGHTALHYALLSQNKSLVEHLLKKGSDPNLATEKGSTSLHIIFNDRRHHKEFAKILFELSNEKYHPLQVNARDKLGRTPLQLAVAYIFPNEVDVLLDHGADLSNFAFPDIIASQRYKNRRKLELELASGALAVVESLEKKGFELYRSDALKIMKFFAKYKLFANSMDLEKSWYDNTEFVTGAKEIMVNPSLSLYDLMQLGPEEAAKQITYRNYFEIAKSHELWVLLLTTKQCKACFLYLCEIMSRGFFRSWALDCFYEITHKRLPILCCDKVLDVLENQDLCNICLATTIQSSW
uniref:Uncharacterized protein n=1 Tax=Trichogramma kaykai TaxID=54128 RepID=A0ABD2XCX2_9HYME